jgi:hypothetical protein
VFASRKFCDNRVSNLQEEEGEEDEESEETEDPQEENALSPQEPESHTGDSSEQSWQ